MYYYHKIILFLMFLYLLFAPPPTAPTPSVPAEEAKETYYRGKRDLL
jgi:hypothetical protein